jgi:hypothetical protein
MNTTGHYQQNVDEALDRAVVRNITAIEWWIVQRPAPKSSKPALPTNTISIAVAADIVGQPPGTIHQLISRRKIVGNLYTRTVSLSSLMAWKGLQDEKKQHA